MFETEKEMLESEKVCKDFDFAITKNIASRIGTKRVILTGMGSSMIFPAKQAKNRALRLSLKNNIEVFFASDLLQYQDLSNTVIFLCSNSGRTKETILLAEHAKKSGAFCVAITSEAESLLAQKCNETILLTSGKEKGVAATKSVVEQGLIYDSLIFNLAKNQGIAVDFENLKNNLIEVSRFIENNANLVITNGILTRLAAYSRYFFNGLETGVAEEITLKSFEIARKMAIFYPDTHILHGPIEALHNDCIIVFDSEELESFKEDFQKLAEKTNSMFISVSKKTGNNSIVIESNKDFQNYCLLAAGWGILRNISKYLNIDMDHPQKVSKVGNPFIV